MIKWLLAWRYFIKRPISILAVAAVTLCVFIVVVVMTVMNGLVREFKEKNHEYAGDCVIHCESLVGFGYYEGFLDILGQQTFVEAVSPVVKGIGMVSMPQLLPDYNEGIEIYGIDPVLHSQATAFSRTLHYTKDIAQAFSPEYNLSLEGCIPGVDVIPYRRNPDGGYFHWEKPVMLKLVISSFPLNIKGGLLKAGTDVVSTKTFFYADDSHSGLVKVDGYAVYIPLEQAQIMCGMDTPIKRISDIHIKFADHVSIHSGVQKVQALWNEYVTDFQDKPGVNLFENVRVQSWQDNRREIIAPMEKEQIMMTMLFLMLGIITVFIIFVVLYMIISHKSKDIGILKSIGMPVHGILGVFLIFAIFVGLIGSLFGGVAGCLFLIKVNDIENWLYVKYGWQLWDKTIYAIPKIPNEIQPDVIAIIIGSAIFACIIGALIPSLQAARKTPTQSLQVNQL